MAVWSRTSVASCPSCRRPPSTPCAPPPHRPACRSTSTAASVRSPPSTWALLAVSGGAAAPPGGDLAITVEISNSGGTTWQPGATFLGTTRPNDRASAVHHASWSSPSRAATVEATTAPGETGRFIFTAQVPADAVPGTAIDETFGQVEEGVTWFGPDDIALHIDVASGTGDGDELGGDLATGCAAGGAAAPGAPALLGLALAWLWLRRRSA